MPNESTFVKLLPTQIEFLTGSSATILDDGEKKMYFLPFVYISRPSVDIFILEEKRVSDLSNEEKRCLHVNNIFTLQDMQEFAEAMSDYGKGKYGSRGPKQYLKEEFNINM